MTKDSPIYRHLSVEDMGKLLGAGGSHPGEPGEDEPPPTLQHGV